MVEATHLVKVWFFINSKEPLLVIRARMLERFKFLGDALENIIVEPLDETKEKKQKRINKNEKGVDAWGCVNV